MFESSEPIRLQLLFDVGIDVIQNLLHILNRLVNRLLLSHHLLLPTCPHQRSLLNQTHHLLLLLTTCYDLLLTLRILQHELTRTDLHLIAGGWYFLPFFLVGIVVVFNEQVDASFEVGHQILRIIEGQSNELKRMLAAELFSHCSNHIRLLFCVVHLHE